MPRLKYLGFAKTVNKKPEGEYILMFAKDWNGDHWGFYAYIGLNSYEDDIKSIENLVQRLNWRDGDTYYELIDHSDGLKKFYYELYDLSRYSDHNVLDPEKWRKIADERATAKVQA